MARLILHVGPGKCGSSSIQQFFAGQDNPCAQNTRYKLANPFMVSALNKEEPDHDSREAFFERFLSDLTACDALVLSHEYLFQAPQAIKHICQLAREMAEEIIIVGYSRRQSDFIVSAYSQWLFRSPERVQEVTDTLHKIGADPILFSGLERQIIASIENDFYSARQLSEYSILDWNQSYSTIVENVRGMPVTLRCGMLPTRGSGRSLVNDFCDKAGLTLRPEINGAAEEVANLHYNHDIVEAMHNAVELGLEVPGPHENNEIFRALSSITTPINTSSSEFISNLKVYVDSFFWHSNQQFCITYGLDSGYFRPLQVVSKAEVIDTIVFEGYMRSLNKSAIIESYRKLSATMIELCIKQAKSA